MCYEPQSNFTAFLSHFHPPSLTYFLTVTAHTTTPQAPHLSGRKEQTVLTQVKLGGQRDGVTLAELRPLPAVSHALQSDPDIVTVGTME